MLSVHANLCLSPRESTLLIPKMLSLPTLLLLHTSLLHLAAGAPQLEPRSVDIISCNGTESLLEKRAACSGDWGACVKYYSGQGCKGHEQLNSYVPTCEGNKWTDSA